MVRKYAHLSSEHLAQYGEQFSRLIVVNGSTSARNLLRA